ncbi:MAG: nucleotide exchange factor GrpE [Caldanaerobacter subterraneus]|nr:nucleotide exchange factor GrpE [Caldanaerobacter subterraneus]
MEELEKDKIERNEEMSEEVKGEGPPSELQQSEEVVEEKMETEVEQKKEPSLEEIVEELRKKLEEKEKEASEYLDIAQRIKAEFENYRKRTEREKADMIMYGQEQVIVELLPVVDNFERALAAEGDYNSLKEGLELIYKQLKRLLDKFEVREIEAEGEIFDPYKHHAIAQEEVEGKRPNEIIEVFQKGYYMKDKVIRYSLVKVAK